MNTKNPTEITADLDTLHEIRFRFKDANRSGQHPPFRYEGDGENILIVNSSSTKLHRILFNVSRDRQCKIRARELINGIWQGERTITDGVIRVLPANN